MAASRRAGRSCKNSSRRIETVLAALTACVAAFLVVAPAGALAISRNNVLVRAQAVVNSPIPYSQSKYVGSWRNDCSGYVSWVWGTGSNLYTTRNLSSISHPIDDPTQLQPGDVLLKYDSHVRLFYAWANDAHTKYVSYEQTPPRTWSSIQDLSADINAGYKPYRYNKITDSPPPWNVLRNSTFNVWDKGPKSNDTHPEAWVPVWWVYDTYPAGSPGTSWQLRKDLFSSSVFALGLTNANPSPDVVAYAQQSVSVEPGKTYNLFANAGTTTYPSAVRIRLQVYNAANAVLTDMYSGGHSWGIGAAALKPMSLPTVMPATASRAVVSVSLLGSTGTAAGAAVFDDPTLYVTSPLPVYRFLSRKTGAHFYSASGPERDFVADMGASTYSYEGVAYGVVASAANDDPLYRFYNKQTGNYFYTCSEVERDDVVKRFSSMMTLEGEAYRVSAALSPGAETVYRFYNKNTGTHFYTASETERDRVKAELSSVFDEEGPAFYLAK